MNSPLSDDGSLPEMRVGVVGAHPQRSWAKDSHIPAIAQLPGMRLAAVATRDIVSARAAAEAFGAQEAFGDAYELCRSAGIDLVSVCVKVPEHAGIVRAALAAGKHVYCEWPLGRDVREAEALAEEASRTDVRCAIGLQARMSPALQRAALEMRRGTIGRPRSARIVSTTSGYAAALPAAYAYLNKVESGANLATILGGHTLDAAEAVLGSLLEVDARAVTRHREVRLADTGEIIRRETPDHVLIIGLFASGCIGSIEIGGDRPADTPFTFEITGESGSMMLRGGHPHGFQAGEIRLEIDGEAIETPATVAAGGLKGAAGNVGGLYAAFGNDIHAHGHEAPDFFAAARLTRLIDTVMRASESGRRQFIEEKTS